MLRRFLLALGILKTSTPWVPKPVESAPPAQSPEIQAKRQALDEFIAKYQQQDVIFREKQFISPVRVDRISVSDWGASVALSTIPHPGFTLPQPAPFSFKVSGSWDVLGVGEDSMSAMYAGWSLYCNPETVQGAIALAQGFGPEAPVILRWGRLSEFLNQQ